ncbi:MAG: hypothetical protein HQ565_08660 [Bacteroidetes bacterium]|nr:hypothetical protein [Bacteroidota bacterium]
MEPQSNSTNPQLIAIVSYLTFIGWIIAFVLYQNDKSELAIFHIRQTLGIYLLGIVGMLFLCIPLIGWILSILLPIFIFVLWIIGLVNAAQGETKPVPLVGEFIQDLFKSIR